MLQLREPHRHADQPRPARPASGWSRRPRRPASGRTSRGARAASRAGRAARRTAAHEGDGCAGKYATCRRRSPGPWRSSAAATWRQRRWLVQSCVSGQTRVDEPGDEVFDRGSGTSASVGPTVSPDASLSGAQTHPAVPVGAHEQRHGAAAHEADRERDPQPDQALAADQPGSRARRRARSRAVPRRGRPRRRRRSAPRRGRTRCRPPAARRRRRAAPARAGPARPGRW